jgi:hypothetical protein
LRKGAVTLNKTNDSYGLPISNAGAALSLWQDGLHCADTFDSSGIVELSAAVKSAPNFALAHAALAKQQRFHGFGDDSQASLAAAQALINEVTDREASLIHVLTATLSFDEKALGMALTHIDHWPVDRFVFSLVIGPFGLLAFSQKRDWREHGLSLIQRHQQQWPSDDWWYLSALAFSQAECGSLEESEEAALQAWEQSPNGNCAHTLSHVYKEQNNSEAGSEFLKSWLANQGASSDMRHHLAWHLALLDLESGNADKTSLEKLFREEFDPRVSDPMPLTTYSDNASILWRCGLNKTPLDLAFVEQTLDYGKQAFPELGFSFVDMHRVLLTALSGREKEVTSLRSEISQQGSLGTLQSLLDGALAFTQGDYTNVKRHLEPVLNDTVLLGGSNPQRAIVLETYNAAIKSC